MTRNWKSPREIQSLIEYADRMRSDAETNRKSYETGVAKFTDSDLANFARIENLASQLKEVGEQYLKHNLDGDECYILAARCEQMTIGLGPSPFIETMMRKLKSISESNYE